LGFKKDGLWGILNTKNERVTEPIYTSLTRFNDNWIVASKKLPYNSNIVYGVIDAKGNAEIAFQYHSLEVNNNQLIASINKEDHYLYGILDDRGKSLLPINYDRIVAITETLYKVTKQNTVAVFNAEGENLTGLNLDSVCLMENENIQIFRNGKTGLVANRGSWVISPTYKSIAVKDGKVEAQKFREWIAFDNGNKPLSTYSYDRIIPLGKKLYKVSVGEAEALIHQNDSLLTPFSNFKILDQYGEWISVKKEGKSGVLHFDGDVFLAPAYDSIKFENNVFIVKYKKDGKRGWSIINPSGKVITDQVYDEIDRLGDSYFKARRGNYWGVVNGLGKEIIFCKYDSIVQYTQGKLLVKFLGEDGILNLDGNWEILPQKKDIEIVDPMRYLIRSPFGSYVAYYPDTKDFTAEYFLYRHGDRYLEKTLDMKFGLLDEEGKRVIKPEFDEIFSLQEDSIYYAKSEKGHSFITKSGEIMNANDDRFEEIREMSERFIGVKIDGRWGFVDIHGKLRIANQYENIGPYNEGLAPIKILGRWGYIDKREDIIVQPAYDTVYSFRGGLCEVVKKGKFGLISAFGKIALECEYDDLKKLKTGGYLSKRDGKYGLVSPEGRLLILPRFDKVEDLDNGYVIASRKGKFGLLSNDGVDIIPMIYEELKYDRFNDVYLAAKSSEWIELEIREETGR
ncbi:MAG: WG repeat-containing protein, partial [Cytophagales bacterium]|nr:WG repeat-containing protein [Cytophagales bacterium]